MAAHLVGCHAGCYQLRNRNRRDNHDDRDDDEKFDDRETLLPSRTHGSSQRLYYTVTPRGD